MQVPWDVQKPPVPHWLLVVQEDTEPHSLQLLVEPSEHMLVAEQVSAAAGETAKRGGPALGGGSCPNYRWW